MLAYDLKALSAPLPEDIQRLKEAGCFQEALYTIEARLSSERTPDALKKRLILEREIIKRIPANYPFPEEAVQKRLSEVIADYQEKELALLLQEGGFEWIFIEGKRYFHKLFLENLLKTRRAYAARCTDPSLLQDAKRNRELLCESMLRAKENGSRKVHFHLRVSLRLTEEGIRKYKGKTLRAYLPLPVEYAQVHDYRLLSISPLPKAVAGAQYPQRTAVFEAVCTGEERFSAEFSFDNITDYQDPGPEDVLFAQPAFYLGEEEPHIRFTPYLRALCREIIGGETNPLLKARRIYDYITTHVQYSYVRPYSTFSAIPEFVASSLKGDCGFQALLFITLCRIAGVPARWQSGLYATPYEVGCHDWAQYYVAPYGWLYADCSFGGAAYRQGDEERRVFYGANLDPYRIPQASEFQHGFVVPEGAFRADPYDNQDGEIICGGEALLPGADFVTEHEMLELSEIF